jgi:hypothetical protein
MTIRPWCVRSKSWPITKSEPLRSPLSFCRKRRDDQMRRLMRAMFDAAVAATFAVRQRRRRACGNEQAGAKSGSRRISSTSCALGAVLARATATSSSGSRIRASARLASAPSPRKARGGFRAARRPATGRRCGPRAGRVLTESGFPNQGRSD